MKRFLKIFLLFISGFLLGVGSGILLVREVQFSSVSEILLIGISLIIGAFLLAISLMLRVNNDKQRKEVSHSNSEQEL